MQATPAPRQRRRRFPERELLERLRQYEDLLRRNNVKFVPLRKDPSVDQESPEAGADYGSDDEPPAGSSPSATVKTERVYEAKYVPPSPSS